MIKKEDIIMSWSGGKDSSFALHQILKEGKYNVKYLFTNIYKPNRRVSMHGVPEKLINEQAKQIGIPLKKLYIEEKTHEEYEKKMKAFLEDLKKEGIRKVAFGDIFLADLKKYRENKMNEVGMKAIFPLWKQNTQKLAQQFINEGFRTHICSIDESLLSKKFVGVDYSKTFITDLPKNIDPCGENGEFHTFCYDGPIFKTPILFQQNGIVTKTYSHNNKDYIFLFSDISNY
jgi:uncharacterized protein (TIGR00290 family)